MSARSFSVIDGADTSTPGRLIPLWLDIGPPCTTRATTRGGCTSSTTRSRRPSLIRMRSPTFTSVASSPYVTGTSPASATASGASTMSLPSSSMIGAGRSPMRIRGPWRSPSIATGRPTSLAMTRTALMTSACCSCVPCEKLMRATFIPAVMSARKTAGDDDAGPIVQTILVRAIWREMLGGVEGVEVVEAVELLTRPSPRSLRSPRQPWSPRLSTPHHLLLETLQQTLERFLERGEPVDQQLVGHGGERNAQRLEIGDCAPLAIDVRVDRASDDAVIAERINGLRRHRVDGVGTDEGLDVHHVPVRRILGAGARPEGALHARALGGERLPSGARKALLEQGVGELRVGDSRATPQRPKPLGVAGRRVRQASVDAFVDLGVDAAHEEAGNGCDPIHRLAVTHAVLEPTKVGLDDVRVGVEREEQRDVDVDAVGDEAAGGNRAIAGAGHLDHDVRTADHCPQATRFCQRFLDIVGGAR